MASTTHAQVIVSTPDGFVIGTISSVYTFCRSVYIGTSPVSQSDSFRGSGLAVPSLKLPNVSLRGPIGTPIGGRNFTPDDVWEGVQRWTFQLKRTPGSCANPVWC